MIQNAGGGQNLEQTIFQKFKILNIICNQRSVIQFFYLCHFFSFSNYLNTKNIDNFLNWKF